MNASLAHRPPLLRGAALVVLLVLGAGMSICSKLCSSALMQIHKPGACVARRSSIRSAR
jgi:hypothetical protein